MSGPSHKPCCETDFDAGESDQDSVVDVGDDAVEQISCGRTGRLGDGASPEPVHGGGTNDQAAEQ